MSKILEVLETYENFELAFILKYRASSYMPDTRQKIIDELRDRGLDTKEKIDAIIEQRKAMPRELLSKDACIVCTSTKTFARPHEYVASYARYDYKSDREVTISQNPTCSVCGVPHVTKETIEQNKQSRVEANRTKLIVVAVFVLFFYLLSLWVR